MKPVFFSPNVSSHRRRIFSLRRRKDIRVFDSYRDQLYDLFLVRNPDIKLSPKDASRRFGAFLSEVVSKHSLFECGRWVFFAWNKTLVHLLNQEDFYELRTARNRDLITPEEQEVLSSSVLSIAGLSVGNSAFLTLLLEGFSDFHISDPDTLSVSNLNRIRSGVSSLGVSKTNIALEEAYELHPYAIIHPFSRGIRSMKNALLFLKKDGRPVSALIEEVDDIGAKILLRQVASKLRVPVVTATDCGNNALIDVERFDIEPRRELFHGALRGVSPQTLSSMDFPERMKLVDRIVGRKFLSSRMKESLSRVGNTLYSWPQLGSAVMLSGAAVAHVVRKIVLGSNMPSGRYVVDFDGIFNG